MCEIVDVELIVIVVVEFIIEWYDDVFLVNKLGEGISFIVFFELGVNIYIVIVIVEVFGCMDISVVVI